MCYNTLARYCSIDDFLKTSGYRQDVRAEVSDSEVITRSLTAMLKFSSNFAKSRLILHELGLMKRLLSRSRKQWNLCSSMPRSALMKQAGRKIADSIGSGSISPRKSPFFKFKAGTAQIIIDKEETDVVTTDRYPGYSFLQG